MTADTPYKKLTQSNSTRQQILNAAMLSLIQNGLARTNISAIASAASVSRPTVYSHFENIEVLIREAITEGTRLLSQRVVAKAAAETDPRERLVKAFLEILELAEEIDVLRAPPDYVARLDPSKAEDDGSIMSEAVAVARDVLAALFGESPPPGDADEVAETVIRFFLSLAGLKRPPGKQDDVAGYIRRVVVPAIGYPTDASAV